MNLIPGSYVTHVKLPELGAGEILFVEHGSTSIRFASGVRTLKVDVVQQYLVVTTPAPPQKAKRARKAAAARTASKA